MKQAARPNRLLFTLLIALLAPIALSFQASAADVPGAAPAAAVDAPAVYDLNDLKKNPDKYKWFDFRPLLKKLILAGTPESQHISILWYPTPKGSVGLHYHEKTESVFAIDGSQADAKGVYPTGTLYFNPPGSGHAITDSNGFFILAYASPPDFKNTNMIGEYTPARFDTASADFEKSLQFKSDRSGAGVYKVALDPQGGMSSEFIRAGAGNYQYTGNYLLVIKGSCTVDGAARAKGMLVVGTTTVPRRFQVAAPKDSGCLLLGLSFTSVPAK